MTVLLLGVARSTPRAPIPIPRPDLVGKNQLGRNILHISCQVGHLDRSHFLLALTSHDLLTVRDYAGFRVCSDYSTCSHSLCYRRGVLFCRGEVLRGFDSGVLAQRYSSRVRRICLAIRFY